ncbi:MAG: hypothetical protein MI919_04935 [Holophagales bacterium]|nr:hypothetical protein [Holophagales bacterium]
MVLLALVVSALSLPAIAAESSGSGCDGYTFDFPEGTPLVSVAFWDNDRCEGEPLCQIPFPVAYGDRECFAWPGSAGENSATRFECSETSLSYTQWTTLTCSGGQMPEGRRKTAYTDRCEQDWPPTLYGRIVDFSGCDELDGSRSTTD